MSKGKEEAATSELRRRAAELLIGLAANPEADGYQVLAGVAVQEFNRIAEALQGQREVAHATAQALALLAKAADAQGKAMETLTAELRAHRAAVEELIAELQHMQGDDQADDEGNDQGAP